MSSTNSLLLSRHEHHHTASEIDPSLPRGSLIFVHAGLQALAWGLVFPLGMVLGLKKSRWHIPVQVAGLAMTGAGFVLGAFGTCPGGALLVLVGELPVARSRVSSEGLERRELEGATGADEGGALFPPLARPQATTTEASASTPKP